LDYYDKHATAITQIRDLLHDAAALSRRDKKDLLKLESVLQTVVDDHHLQDRTKALREKIVIFDRLRQIMRLATKNGAQGLNDNGSLFGQRELKTIEKELKTYTTTLAKRASRTHFKNRHPQLAAGIKQMVKQIRVYWHPAKRDLCRQLSFKLATASKRLLRSEPTTSWSALSVKSNAAAAVVTVERNCKKIWNSCRKKLLWSRICKMNNTSPR
jgi:hypothetical protein